MLRVYFDCCDRYINIIKRKLQSYFQDIEYIDRCDEKKIIIIKDIYTDKDIKDIVLRKNYQYVFLIENGEYMFELLEYEPIAFIRISEIEKDLPKLIKMMQFENRGIGVMLDFKSGRQKIRIDAENIEFIESYGHYLFIHTSSTTFKVREKISSLFERLQPLDFIQVHKSYVINKKYIKQQTVKDIILLSEVRIPLGNHFKKKIISKKQE